MATSAMASMTLALEMIDDYRAAPALWNKKHPDYKDKEARSRDLQRLARKYALTERAMEKKLHNLRSQFTRELKNVRDARKNNTTVKKRMWFGYRRMMFLLGDEGAHHLRKNFDPWNDDSGANTGSDLESLCSYNSQLVKAESDQDSDGTELDFDDMTASNEMPNSNIVERMQMDAQAKELTEGSVSSHDRPARGTSKRAASELSGQTTASAAKRSKEPPGTEWDEFDAYGKYVAHKMRNSNKSRIEIAVAQRDIEDVFIKLELGVYASPEAQGKERVFLA